MPIVYLIPILLSIANSGLDLIFVSSSIEVSIATRFLPMQNMNTSARSGQMSITTALAVTTSFSLHDELPDTKLSRELRPLE
jgi:hypothetical protein